MLPAWLGVGKAIAAAADAGLLPVLQDMYVNFPFFRSTIDLVEMARRLCRRRGGVCAFRVTVCCVASAQGAPWAAGVGRRGWVRT